MNLSEANNLLRPEPQLRVSILSYGNGFLVVLINSKRYEYYCEYPTFLKLKQMIPYAPGRAVQFMRNNLERVKTESLTEVSIEDFESDEGLKIDEPDWKKSHDWNSWIHNLVNDTPEDRFPNGIYSSKNRAGDHFYIAYGPFTRVESLIWFNKGSPEFQNALKNAAAVVLGGKFYSTGHWSSEYRCNYSKVFQDKNVAFEEYKKLIYN